MSVTKSRFLCWVSLRRCAVVLAIAAAAFIAGVVVPKMGRRQARELDVVWSATKDATVPGDFAYVLFPSQPMTQLVDTNEGNSGLVLDRAVMCSEQELEAGESVGVWVENRELRVLKDALTFEPPAHDFDHLVSNWKTAVARWRDATDWPEVDVTFEKVGTETYRVEASRTSVDGVKEIFVYRVVRGVPSPECWYVDRVKKMAR